MHAVPCKVHSEDAANNQQISGVVMLAIRLELALQ